jgi:hypothetical protein
MKGVEQVCEGYSSRSLMGNWMEQREAVAQPFKADFAATRVRAREPEVCCPAGNGLFMPLKALARKEKWVTRGVVVPDDGFALP